MKRWKIQQWLRAQGLITDKSPQPRERQVVMFDLAGNLIRHMQRAVISDVEHHEDGTITLTLREVVA